MAKAAVEQDHIASPCIGTCTMDPKTDLCIGCFRSRDEIALWRAAGNDVRRDILGNIRERRTRRANAG